MKITAVSIGTRGDIEPLIELGVEMNRRGHEFRVAGMEGFRSLCESRDVPFVHLDGDADYFMKLLVTDYKKSMDFVSGYEKFYKSVPKIFNQIADVVKGQDAVFYGICSFFVRSAADLYNVPCIRYFYSPFDKTNQYSLYTKKHNSFTVGLTYLDEELGMNLITKKLMNGWRAEHGLKKWKLTDDYRVQNGKKVLTFYPVSPILMPPDSKWGSHIHVTGYWYHPEEKMNYSPNESLKTFLNDADKEKPIFVAFGKASSPELKELQVRCVKALKETGIRAVVQADQLFGTDTEVNDEYKAENIYYIGNVPYSWIFSQVRAVVHHGGNSTNGLGLRAGLPTLVISLALDQYYYGRTVYELGCGPSPIYIRKRIPTVEELKVAITDLISKKYDKNATKIGEKLKSENGCLAAAEIIEKWHKTVEK